YDDRWFQEQIKGYGIERQGKYTPFPPVTAVLMIPVALLPPEVALRVWTVCNIAMCVATVVLLCKLSGKNWQWSSLLILGSGAALINDVRFGQWYLALVLLMLAGYHLLERKWPIAAGALFGFGAAFKYFPMILLPVLLLRKQWRAAASLIVTTALICCIGVMLLGTQVSSEFFSSVIKDHVAGSIQDPFSATFQSWNSLLRRLFVYDPVLNPSPALDSAVLFHLFRYGVLASVVAISIWVMTLSNRINEHERLGIQMAFVTIAGMLLLPASATYHFLILILPLALLLRGEHAWNIWQRILVACYLMIGFTPYRFFREYDGMQWLTLAAYPRLWLMTIMFIIVCIVVVKISENKLSYRLSRV
ncbi:MAG TPA: glycosyltransferase family 87 protein, partial [Saprospiraceae bacterium]|nr:glycosyltransferase family 87 protein [Saprospiraceae bacterium]